MEPPNSKGSSHVIIGLFVLVTLIVAAGFVVFMGGSSIFDKEVRLYSVFSDAKGLNVGAPVYLAGIDVGRVVGKDFPPDGQFGVRVEFTVSEKFAPRITDRTEVEIATAGMLGDKTLSLSDGAIQGKAVNTGDYLNAKVGAEFSDYLNKGGDAVEQLTEVARNLNQLLGEINKSGNLIKMINNLEAMSAKLDKELAGKKGNLLAQLEETLKKFDSIASKIDNGEGTLGALVNDPSLHEDLRILLGGARRSKLLRYVIRQAISKGEKIEDLPEDKEDKEKR